MPREHRGRQSTLASRHRIPDSSRLLSLEDSLLPLSITSAIPANAHATNSQVRSSYHSPPMGPPLLQTSHSQPRVQSSTLSLVATCSQVGFFSHIPGSRAPTPATLCGVLAGDSRRLCFKHQDGVYWAPASGNRMHALDIPSPYLFPQTQRPEVTAYLLPRQEVPDSGSSKRTPGDPRTLVHQQAAPQLRELGWYGPWGSLD